MYIHKCIHAYMHTHIDTHTHTHCAGTGADAGARAAQGASVHGKERCREGRPCKGPRGESAPHSARPARPGGVGSCALAKILKSQYIVPFFSTCSKALTSETFWQCMAGHSHRGLASSEPGGGSGGGGGGGSKATVLSVRQSDGGKRARCVAVASWGWGGKSGETRVHAR